MHFLITGIGGFLGTRLARHLLAQGDRVSGTFLETRPDFDGVDLFEADLLDTAALRRAVDESAPDVVVHLGALSHVGESWKRIPDYFRVNVLGTENLLAAVGRRGGRRVLVASSAEVYGIVPDERQPIGEDEGLDPRSPYALTKAAAERLALAAGAVVVRSFNLVGPGQSPIFALPAFAMQLAAISRGARGEQEPVLRVGNLSARRDFAHVDDGVAALRLLAEKGEPGGIYNISTGKAVSIGEALERLMAVSGVQARLETDPERIRPVDIPLLAGDPSRLRALGWEPRRTLDDALADLWETVR
ncbi:MAG TPA: GDP-mannose 4,6-dehydratase [Thermoanaerobaculia bacterium]|nr:GDP-mannose 4,6-dehydratase [Thermoanaerobaculia bacterium]